MVRNKITVQDSNSVDHAAEYVRLALPLMSRHGVPVTPMNYTVWYSHVSGENVELSREIENMIALNTPFSEESMEGLYFRYFGQGQEQALRELREDIRKILSDIFSDIRDMGGQAADFGTTLEDSFEKLEAGTPVEEIRIIVSGLVSRTRQMATSGKQMQQKLQRATEELESLHKEVEQARSEATVDFLTGVANRRAFDKMLKDLVQAPETVSSGLSLLLVDIDHFKKFNDTHGHLVGDQVLKITAREIKALVKGRDFLARFGGEEFVVILPRTPLAGARVVGESIRKTFEQNHLVDHSTKKSLGRLTVSIGAAQLRPSETVIELIDRCDDALYAAKKQGRNRVVLEGDVNGQDVPA